MDCRRSLQRLLLLTICSLFFLHKVFAASAPAVTRCGWRGRWPTTPTRTAAYARICVARCVNEVRAGAGVVDKVHSIFASLSFRAHRIVVGELLFLLLVIVRLPPHTFLVRFGPQMVREHFCRLEVVPARLAKESRHFPKRHSLQNTAQITPRHIKHTIAVGTGQEWAEKTGWCVLDG